MMCFSVALSAPQINSRRPRSKTKPKRSAHRQVEGVFFRGEMYHRVGSLSSREVVDHYARNSSKDLLAVGREPEPTVEIAVGETVILLTPPLHTY